MNQELFNKLAVKRSGPSVRYVEWRTFLEVCYLHLKRFKIENPIAVELGVWRGRQKKFYEQLLGAEHIGIDIRDRYINPDILGDLHEQSTLNKLKERLDGRPINILFIDGNHSYDSVKKDYEMYAPLCTDIVAFHDIESSRYYAPRPTLSPAADGVWRFWDKLRKAKYAENEISEKWLFLSIHQCHFKERRRRQLGIGVIIKK